MVTPKWILLESLQIESFVVTSNSSAFGEAEKVIGLLPVVFGLQVLVTVLAFGHDYIDRATTTADIESPFTCLDPSHGILLRDIPSSAIPVATANVRNAFMLVRSIAFVDAEDFVSARHCPYSFAIESGEQILLILSIRKSKERAKAGVRLSGTGKLQQTSRKDAVLGPSFFVIAKNLLQSS